MTTVLALAVVLCAGWCGSAGAARLGGPGVIGQMVAGLVIGPIAVGALFPGVEAWLFSAGTRSVIAVVGGIAAAVLLFNNGVEHGRSPVRLGGAGVAWLTGANLVAAAVVTAAVVPALRLVGGGTTSPTQFVFVVVALAVCALPVLSRIIEQSGFSGTRVARSAFAVGMSTDVIAWSLVALLAVVRGASSRGQGVVSAVALVATAAGWTTLRRLIAWVLVRASAPMVVVTAGVTVGGAAGLADVAHVDPVLGALLAGLVFGGAARRSDANRRAIQLMTSGTSRVNDRVLLPVFFASTGLSVHLRGAVLPVLVVSAVVAVAGVLVRALAVATARRRSGLNRHDAYQLAVLLCARGATELAMLQVGNRLGLMPSAHLTPFVFMAVVTTILSGLLARGPGSRSHPASSQVSTHRDSEPSATDRTLRPASSARQR